MATKPYLVSAPDSTSMPSRTLVNGVSAYAINAESVADAKAFAKAQAGNDADLLWTGATVTEIAAATDMSGWSMRLKVVSPLGVTIFDETVDADGTSGLTKATGTLTLTPGAISDDVVKIDTTYYKFAADPTTGTPTGLVGAPYLVAVGANDTAAFANLRKAINATGTGGVDYAAEIVAPHATVEATASDATTLSVRALVGGSTGNAISTTVTATGGADGLAWGDTVLAGGVGAAAKVSALALRMVTVLNATADIDAAAFDDGTAVLTVAETTDGLGDHRVFAYFIPDGADTDIIGVPGFVVSKADDGSAGDALTLTLASDAYEVPNVVALLGAAA